MRRLLRTLFDILYDVFVEYPKHRYEDRRDDDGELHL